ncbi:universal stress protein [Variovorax paradoxus]|uniref:universal stress protein n=1 Tax=Variovorax paradoxus TaxID=34073 RepID=UPI00247FCE2A|nr:universal stress protein [Variovorax paradoxus]WGT61335.1 universal stress protein [Variovorax paradoxus]
MTPKSILAITDLTARTASALSRAARLAAEHNAALKLVHAAWSGEGPRAEAACHLAHQALQLEQRHGLRVRTASRPMNTLQDLADEAQGADLLVMSAVNEERSLRSFFCGSAAERLMRIAGRPVLVVRQPADAPYQRLLIAVDFSQASRMLVEHAFALHPSAQVELFHAISTVNERKLRGADVPEHVVEAYRHECRRHAQDQMLGFADSTEARRNRVSWALGRGDAGRQAVVQQQHSGAELLVVGKHRASALSDFVFGSVAKRVLRMATGDVMVVPHDAAPATRAADIRQPGSVEPMTRRVRAGAQTPVS